MAKPERPTVEHGKIDVEHLKDQIDLLDQRLDNIDTVLSALVERLMRNRIALNLTCPNCGKQVEVSIVGTTKPTA